MTRWKTLWKVGQSEISSRGIGTVTTCMLQRYIQTKECFFSTPVWSATVVVGPGKLGEIAVGLPIDDLPVMQAQSR